MTDELASRRTRRSGANSFQLFKIFSLLVGGGSVLAALLAAGRFVHLDNLLVLSKTIFNIITGLQQIGAGVALLLTGLAQALGLLGVSLAAMIAVLAVASGALRLLSHALPGLGAIWKVMAQILNAIVAMLGFPQPLENSPSRAPRSSVASVPLTSSRRSRSAVRLREAG